MSELPLISPWTSGCCSDIAKVTDEGPIAGSVRKPRGNRSTSDERVDSLGDEGEVQRMQKPCTIFDLAWVFVFGHLHVPQSANLQIA